MDNKPVEETDVPSSDKIKGETYSTTERWIIFIAIYVVSLIICIIYLLLRIDVKQFSFPIFILCLIYSSLFVMLNVMSMYDLLFSHEVGMKKFFEMVSIFYKVFNWADKMLGYIIFNLLITMMESGYYANLKIFFDYWIKIWKSIPKKLCEIIIRLIFAGGILFILIYFRERFDLGKNPFDYFSIILDVFGMLEIYTNVGFFMLQIILDYKRKKDQKKINRYDIYSKIKIIESTEKCMEKIKNSYNELKKDAKIFENNNEPEYHKYLQKVYKEIKEKVIEYGYEINNEENNIDLNNNPNNNNNSINNNVNMNINDNNTNGNNINVYTINNNINTQEPETKDNNENTARFSHLNQADSQNNKEQSTINKTDNTNDKKKVKKENFDTSKNIRKFKKAVRKINKLKKLYEEIDKETNEDLARFRKNKKCTCGFVILFIAFSIVLLTDFLLPIIFDPEDDFTKSVGEEHEKLDSVWEFIIGIILIYPASVITSSYTLIMIYTNKRKDYISGDYLYDKQINDNINLLKTVQIVCGYSFSILYCNLYYWRTIDSHGHYGKPKFYDTTFIPDYTFKQGITIFMIAKIILIVASIIGSYYCSSWKIFQNDLGEFDKSGDYSRYDNPDELNRIYQEKGQVVDFLNR